MALIQGDFESFELWSLAYENHTSLLIILLALGTIVCGFSAAACLRGCRKTRNKDKGGEDLHGPKGNIIKTNPDETQICVEHSERQLQPNDAIVIDIFPDEINSHETRPLTTAKRSLPDIPVDHLKDGTLGDHKVGSRSVPREMDSMDSSHKKCDDPEIGEIGGGTHSGGDTSSDLYATVEDATRDGLNNIEAVSRSAPSGAKKRMAPMAPARDLEMGLGDAATKNSDKTTVKPSQDFYDEEDEEDVLNRYSRLNKEHPYDCLKTSEEHPYAQVTSSKSDHGTALYYNEIGSNNKNSLCGDGTGVAGENPIPPPRVHRRSQSGNNGNCTSSPPSTHIPAAKAISGGISANQELPYMTPPINLDHSNPSTSALLTNVSSSLPSRALTNGPAHPGLETGPFQQRGSRGNFHNLESQDSNSYTSISVREPIASIKAQITEQQKNTRPPSLRAVSKSLRSNDPHYASVSDDSDEMYAAIGDRSGSSQAIYGSGSETYAQIQPQPILPAVHGPAPPLPSHRGETSPNSPSNLTFSPLPASSSPNGHHLLPPAVSPIPGSPVNTTIPQNGGLLGSQQPSPPPQPPSVDSLRQVAQVHSRQASSSSATSSTVNLGSPKPEKRQANSPLPPPPLVPTLAVPEKDDDEPTKIGDVAEIELRNEKAANLPQNLEEMYAKVIKKNKRKTDGTLSQGLPIPLTTAAESTHRSLASSNSSLVTAAINGMPGRLEPDDQRTSSRRKSSEGSSMTTSDPDLSLDVRLSLALGEDIESEAELVNDGDIFHTNVDATAATVSDLTGQRSRGNLSVGMRPGMNSRTNKLDEGDGSGYESVGSRSGEGGLNSLRRKTGDDGYEELKPRQMTSTRGDPGYERVRRRGPGADEDEDDEEDKEGEPRYEKVSARGRDGIPGYETVRDHKESNPQRKDCIPGYETVRDPDESNELRRDSIPGYEMVRNHNEPNTKGRDGIPGYETVRGHNESTMQDRDGIPGYETVRDHNETTTHERDGIPGYETVRDHNETTTHERDGIPGYETLRDCTESIGEPDYERMKGDDDEPNYESVGYSGSISSPCGSQGNFAHNDYESLAGVHNGGNLMVDKDMEPAHNSNFLEGGPMDASQLDAMYATVQKGKSTEHQVNNQ